jgi:hypothetical protein
MSHLSLGEAGAMKMKYLNVNVIGAVGVLVAGTARVANAQGSGDRCALLTPAAVSAAAGVTVAAGKPIATTGCSWESAKPHVIVTVSFPGPAMSGVFTKETPTPGVTRAHPGGIGDDAVYVSAANLTTLYVKHAKDILMVRVYGIPDDDKQKSIEKALALDVLKKL